MKAEESILIERLKKGERTAFNELYGIFWAPLVNYAELIVGDENADDVVQEVFVRIWVGRDKLRNDGSLRGYLLRAVYRTALNVLRSKNYASSYRSQTKLQIEQQLWRGEIVVIQVIIQPTTGGSKIRDSGRHRNTRTR